MIDNMKLALHILQNFRRIFDHDDTNEKYHQYQRIDLSHHHNHRNLMKLWNDLKNYSIQIFGKVHMTHPHHTCQKSDSCIIVEFNLIIFEVHRQSQIPLAINSNKNPRYISIFHFEILIHVFVILISSDKIESS